MDAGVVREHAERHGRAVVEGDLAVAGADLSDQVKPKASSIMKHLPSPLSRADVTSVEPAGAGYMAVTRYSGGEERVSVCSTWAEVDGRAQIVELDVC